MSGAHCGAANSPLSRCPRGDAARCLRQDLRHLRRDQLERQLASCAETSARRQTRRARRDVDIDVDALIRQRDRRTAVERAAHQSAVCKRNLGAADNRRLESRVELDLAIQSCVEPIDEACEVELVERALDARGVISVQLDAACQLGAAVRKTQSRGFDRKDLIA